MRDRYGDKITVRGNYTYTGPIVLINFYYEDEITVMELDEDGANKFIKKIRKAIKENK